MQLFRHSLKHGICLWASKWRVITALILIFIQVLSSQLSRSSWPNLKNESWSRRVERGSLFKYKVSCSHIQGRNIYTCTLGGGANHSASPWLCLLCAFVISWWIIRVEITVHTFRPSLLETFWFPSVVHTKRGCVMDEKRVPERSLNPVQFHTSAHCMLSALMPNSSRFSRVFSLPAEAGNEADERMNYNSELVSHKTTTMGWWWDAPCHWVEVQSWWRFFMAAIL